MQLTNCTFFKIGAGRAVLFGNGHEWNYIRCLPWKRGHYESPCKACKVPKVYTISSLLRKRKDKERWVFFVAHILLTQYRAQTVPCWFYELPREGAAYVEFNSSDLSIATSTANSILILLKHWHAVSSVFLRNTRWGCVLLLDTRSFMCFIRQTARKVSTPSVSRVTKFRNLKCRHWVMRNGLQPTVCVQHCDRKGGGGGSWRTFLLSETSRALVPQTGSVFIIKGYVRGPLKC
jgi:hypothetical protein